MEKFSKLKELYKEELLSLVDGGMQFSLTGRSLGPSHEGDVFELFKAVKLQNFGKFLDLGSGDGRVVLTASLFTRAVGVEIDKKLCEKAEGYMKRLGLPAKFICSDYFDADFSQYDVIFIYPDKPFRDGLERKLRAEFKGLLIVYSSLYLPLHLSPKKIYDTYDEKIFLFDCKRAG